MGFFAALKKLYTSIDTRALHATQRTLGLPGRLWQAVWDADEFQERRERVEESISKGPGVTAGVTPPAATLVQWLQTNVPIPPYSYEELQKLIDKLPVSRRTRLYFSQLLREVPHAGWFSPDPPAAASFPRPDFVEFMSKDNTAIQIFVALRRIGKTYGGPHAVVTAREKMTGSRDVAYLYYAGVGLGADFVNQLPTILTILSYLEIPIILDEFQQSPDIVASIRAFLANPIGSTVNLTPLQVVLFGSNQEAIFQQGRLVIHQENVKIRRLPAPPLALLYAMMLRHQKYQVLNDVQKAAELVRRIGFGGPDLSKQMQLVTYTHLNDFIEAGPRHLTYLSNEQLLVIHELLNKEGQGRDADQLVLQDLVHLKVIARAPNQPNKFVFLDPRLLFWQGLIAGEEVTENERVHTALGYVLEVLVREEAFLRDLLLAELGLQMNEALTFYHGNIGVAEVDNLIFDSTTKEAYFCSVKYAEQAQDLKKAFVFHLDKLVLDLKAEVAEMLMGVEKLVMVRVSLVPAGDIDRDPWEPRLMEDAYKAYHPDFEGTRNKSLRRPLLAKLEKKQAQKPTWPLRHKRVLIHKLLANMPKWPAPLAPR